MLKKIFPFLNWKLTRDSVRSDFIAGLTVALVLIPQSMAYAQLAGLPVVVGLYASFIPVMIGLFAATEVFRQAEIGIRKVVVDRKISGLLPTWQDIKSVKTTLIRSSLIGTFIGILPAEGGTVASFIGYNEAKRFSKEPEKFGTGILDGVAGPECANNSATGGATRAQSVMNGMRFIAQNHPSTQWLLVHDAARPCLPRSCLSELLDRGLQSPDGAILAQA